MICGGGGGGGEGAVSVGKKEEEGNKELAVLLQELYRRPVWNINPLVTALKCVQ
jgi:hypothetical protein